MLAVQKLVAKSEKNGWGGWIRTITVLINSEVSYQLDHAPTSDDINIRAKDLAEEQTQARVGHHSVGASFAASWGFCCGFGQPLYGCQGMRRRQV